MKNIIALLILSIGLLLNTTSSIADSEYPSRKPGLWEIEVESSIGQAQKQIMKQCIDAATDAQLMKSVSSMGEKAGISCSKNDMKKTNGQYIGDSVCSMQGMKISTHSVFTGDFNREYSGDISSSYDPPMAGMKDIKTKVAARWVGPCEAGQKPGEVILPDGRKVNQQQ